jgi:hypothetical protein
LLASAPQCLAAFEITVFSEPSAHDASDARMDSLTISPDWGASRAG